MRHSAARSRRWRTLWPPAAPPRPQPRPDRARALLAVSIALRDGRLEMQPCEVCGAVDGVEAHHDDLTKPLDVRWRCADHLQGASA